MGRPTGPPPKRAAQRRRRNAPASHGQATPTDPQPASPPPTELGFDAHPLIVGLWETLHHSVEPKFYSAADWQRVRIELHYGHQLLSSGKTPGAQAWAAFQSGLNTLLVSPADKRRAGVEMKPAGVDEDEAAAEQAVLAAVSELRAVK
jgi:hypothetical protein